MHSSAYREKYKEFLKIDFPRCLIQKTPQLLETGSTRRTY
ncbi:MAG: type ISP restriction/modification enzyme [Ginsengibacter sp.]